MEQAGISGSSDEARSSDGLVWSVEQLRLAGEASDIGWWDVDQAYGRLSWCPRVKAMFGISAESLTTLDDFFSGLHPEDRDRVKSAYAAAADPERRALYAVEYRTVGKEDQVIRWVSARGRGVFDESGLCKRMIGTALDISVRMQLQEDRLMQDRETAQLREQFIAVLGHDLKNPLAAIGSAVRIIARNSESTGEMVTHIEKRVARMAELIENILDFARGRLGDGIALNLDTAEPLEPILIQVIDELRHVHPDRDIVVDFDLQEPVCCDRPRIGQLLSNLLGNALIYSTPGKPVQIFAKSQNGKLDLSVTNYGDTIEQAHFDLLFQPFVRGKVEDGKGGLGLGLYICSEIAKAHGGTISATSENRLTCFKVQIPAVDTAAQVPVMAKGSSPPI